LLVETDDPVWWDEGYDELRARGSILCSSSDWSRIKTMERLKPRQKLEFLLEHVAGC